MSVGVILLKICFLVHFQFILETRRLLNTFAIMKIGTKACDDVMFMLLIRFRAEEKFSEALINHKFSYECFPCTFLTKLLMDCSQNEFQLPSVITLETGGLNYHRKSCKRKYKLMRFSNSI